MVPIGASADPAKAGPTFAKTARKASSLSTCALGVSHNPQLQDGSHRFIHGFCLLLEDKNLACWVIPAHNRGAPCLFAGVSYLTQGSGGWKQFYSGQVFLN